MRSKWQPPNQPYQRTPWTPRNSFAHRSQASSPTSVSGDFPASQSTSRFHSPEYSLTSIDAPRRVHSNINPYDYVKERVAPRPLESLPPPGRDEKTDWWFDNVQGQTGVEVLFYLVFSPEAVDVIRRWDLHKAVIATEPMFDQATIDKVRALQVAELEATTDEHLRGCRAIEHKQNLEEMRERKHELTLLHYAAFPYREQCENLYEASRIQKRLEGTVQKIVNLLNEHREK